MINVVIFNVLLLSIPVQGLKIQESKLSQDEVDDEKTKPALCSDSKHDPIIKPLLKDIIKFYDGKGFTVYPSAICAVGALRYGGTGTVVNDKRHQIDHDLDLLVVGTPQTDWSATKINQTDLANNHFFGLLEHMNNSGWGARFNWDWKAPDLVEGISATLLFNKKGFKDAKGNDYTSIPFSFKVPTQEFGNRFHDGLWHRAKEMWQQSFSLMEGGISEQPAELPPNSFLHIDLHLRLGSQAEMQPHPTKKMLFHGVTMAYPANPDILSRTLQFAFWYKKSTAGLRAAEQGICGFASPEDVFPEDMPKSPENQEVALKCSTALNAHGYESFASMCHQDKLG